MNLLRWENQDTINQNIVKMLRLHGNIKILYAYLSVFDLGVPCLDDEPLEGGVVGGGEGQGDLLAGQQATLAQSQGGRSLRAQWSHTVSWRHACKTILCFVKYFRL